MPNLESLVPPIELCRMIPRGAFAGTVLVWNEESNPVGYMSRCVLRCNVPINAAGVIFPAPTFEEIMREMAEYPHRFNNLTCDAYAENDFGVTAFIPYRGKAGARLTECRDKSAAAAALKLYLFRIEE